MKDTGHYLHWVGFLGTCFMLVLSALDPSKDEMLIHFIASMILSTLCWILANIKNEKRNYFPFLLELFKV